MSDQPNGSGPTEQQHIDPLQLAGGICLEVTREMQAMKGPATRRDRLALAEALAALSTAASMRDLAAGMAFLIQNGQQQGQPASGLVIPR